MTFYNLGDIKGLTKFLQNYCNTEEKYVTLTPVSVKTYQARSQKGTHLYFRSLEYVSRQKLKSGNGCTAKSSTKAACGKHL